MSVPNLNYSTIIVDLGSGIIKAGFGGEDGPRNIFNSVVGIPKKLGMMVGMEQRERYVGEEAISKLEIMNFSSPIQRGEVVDWDKFETLLHFLFYSTMKIVPEEISILVTETPLSSKSNRMKLAETLFETFNVERLHIANSSMLGLYSYGKTSGLVVDCGFNVTSTVPVYEGYPLSHASMKVNIGGEDISNILLDMIKSNLDESFKGVKGRILADDIKEKLGYLLLTKDDAEEMENEDNEYTLPDGKKIKLNNELYKHCDILFNPGESGNRSIKDCVLDSINKCDNGIKGDIKENICLTGGTTLLKNFPEKLKNEISDSSEGSNFNMSDVPERQFSSWIGGSIVASLDNFQYMWVTKQSYDESGKKLEAIDSKCF
jgi:actin-related protein